MSTTKIGDDVTRTSPSSSVPSSKSSSLRPSAARAALAEPVSPAVRMISTRMIRGRINGGNNPPQPEIKGCKEIMRDWFANYRYSLYFCLICFHVGACFSLQGPFFPYLASTKGVLPIFSSLVFVSFEVSNLIAIFVIGTKGPFTLPRFVLSSGLLAYSVANICFGSLQWKLSGFTFFITAVVIRVVEGVGRAAIFISIFDELATRNLQRFPYVTVLLCISFAFGMVVGPSFGALLKMIGGFHSPFVFFGSLMLIPTILLAMKPLQQHRIEGELEATYVHHAHEILNAITRIIVIHDVVASIIMILTSAISYSYLVMAIQINLRSFHDLDDFPTGVVYTGHGVGLLLVGILSATIKYTTNGYPIKMFYFAKSVFAVLGLFLMGHFLLTAPSQLPLFFSIGAIVHGVGIAGLVTSYMDICFVVVEQNIRELNLKTYQAIAVIWITCFSIGAIFGYIICGFLVTYIDYQIGIISIMGLHVFAVFGVSIIGIHEWLRRRRNSIESPSSSERESLLTYRPSYGPIESSPATFREHFVPQFESAVLSSARSEKFKRLSPPTSLELPSSGRYQSMQTEEKQVDTLLDEPSRHFVISEPEESNNGSEASVRESKKETRASEASDLPKSTLLEAHSADASTSTQSPIEPFPPKRDQKNGN